MRNSTRQRPCYICRNPTEKDDLKELTSPKGIGLGYHACPTCFNYWCAIKEGLI